MTTRLRLASWLLLVALLDPAGSRPCLAALVATGSAAASAAPHQDPPAAERITVEAAAWLARGGGGGGPRGGGGGGGSGGGVSRPAGGFGGQPRPQTGFQGASGGLNRGDGRPAGGWSNRAGGAPTRPSLDRPAGAGGGFAGSGDGLPGGSGGGLRQGNRDLGSGGLGTTTIHRNLNTNVTVNRNWQRQTTLRGVNLHPGWARPGWGVARPWRTGWYGGWSTPSWGWWGARAAVWGIGSLATAAVINAAVDDAINSDASAFVVPNTSYQLLYGTITPVGNGSVRFDVIAEGSTYSLTADCNAGSLDGREPSSAAEAELLNAVCQVAFGST